MVLFYARCLTNFVPNSTFGMYRSSINNQIFINYDAKFAINIMHYSADKVLQMGWH